MMRKTHLRDFAAVALLYVSCIALAVAPACIPSAADIVAGDIVLGDGNPGEHYIEFHNEAPATATLPVSPAVGYSLVYAVLGAGVVTFAGNGKQIKAQGDDLAPALTHGPQTRRTGRLTWNGLHWVNVGGL